MFKNIFESASKLVLLLISFTASVALFTGHLGAEQFMILATGVFAFYFSNKGDSDKPYLGK